MEEEGGEEETQERDSSMDIDGEQHGGQTDSTREPSVPAEHINLPGSPRNNPFLRRAEEDDDQGTIPPIGVDMDNLDNILNHFPVLQAQRVRRIKEVGLFVDFILVEYCQSHLMTLFPNQPDLTWDFAGWWAPNDAHGYTVFLDIVVEGKHMDNFGAFVEHWFAQTDPALVNPFVN